MTTILVLDSSIMPAEKSGSRPLTSLLLSNLRRLHENSSVRYRDLDAERPPHTGMSIFQPPGTDGEASLSSRLTQELLDADIIVIGAPLYNFGISSTLKAWIDHVVIAGKTFRYAPDGTPEGLITGKKAYVVTSRGGIYSHGPMTTFDLVVPYLRASLSFIGITDITFIIAEGLSMGPESRTASIAAAEAQIGQLTGAA